MPDPLTCSPASRQSGEQLFATATRTDYWFVLEVPQVYGRKAFEESELPQAVKAHLAVGAAAVKNGRIQLIKRGNHFDGVGIKFFVAVNHEEQPNLYEFTLSRYDDLLDIDLAGVAAEQKQYRQHDRAEPLYLVCTNGKRDACCAKWGIELYEQMRAIAGDAVWQTSHLGGHRFAPTMATLPHGACYGYVGPQDAPAIITAQTTGTVYLPRYRGRSCYQPNVQAAEYFLRKEYGLLDLYRFKLIEIDPVKESEWIFHFSDLQDGMTYCAQLRSELSDFSVLMSCREEHPEQVTQFRLVDFQRHDGVRRV